MTEITSETIDKIHALLDHGLVAGLGNPAPGQMCVEGAINYALGRPHSDDPGCVADSLRQLKITLNDAEYWSSNQARAEGLRRLAIAQLGSKGALDEFLFARKCALLVASLWDMPQVVRTYLETGDESLRGAAYDAAADAVSFYAADYAVDAAVDAAAAADAASFYAADHAVDAAVDSAVAAIDAAKVNPEAADKILGDFAEGVVQILIEMKAPGVAWLDGKT